MTRILHATAPLPPPRNIRWDAMQYDTHLDYVSRLGRDLVALLDPRPGERVLDLGCGTGDLTWAIAGRGTAHEPIRAMGIDADADMVELARTKYPELTFTVADGHAFSVPEPVDAVFSNAALHWMTRPAAVLGCVRKALKPGGRFVAEFGAAGNLDTELRAIGRACSELGLDAPRPPWYFPSTAAYSALLETAGFQIRSISRFPRPTPVSPEDSRQEWWKTVAASVLPHVPAHHRDTVATRAHQLTRPQLTGPDGIWRAGFVRLRFSAALPS